MKQALVYSITTFDGKAFEYEYYLIEGGVGERISRGDALLWLSEHTVKPHRMTTDNLSKGGALTRWCHWY